MTESTDQSHEVQQTEELRFEDVNTENVPQVEELKSSFPETTYEQDLEKYTKIDNLDEDKSPEMYVLVSFASPEGIMNCTVRALKIRVYNNTSVFLTYELAKKAAEELNKIDKYFPIFVMPCGKWCAWDPSPDDKTKVAEEKWPNQDQQKLMSGLESVEQQRLQQLKQEKNMNDMNALIGKTKDKIDTSKDDHKLRVKDSIAQGMKEKKNQESEKVPVSNSHNASDLKNRLRAKLEEKKKSASTQNEVETSKKLNESVDKLTSQVKSTAETSTKLDENISKAKSLLEKLKQQKNKN
jgi:hypothetical protein